MQDIVEWDVAHWSRAFQLWDQELGGDWHGKRALDLGARGGGLSLYLSLRGCKVAYLDLHPAPEKAHELFLKYGVTEQLDFLRASVTDLPMADASVDVVAFKSVLGSVGRAQGWHGQQVTVAEARRVLRITIRRKCESLGGAPVLQNTVCSMGGRVALRFTW